MRSPEFLDFIYLTGAQPEIGRTDNTIDLAGVSTSNNRAGDGRVAQCPRDRDLAR
jgi:hypothetical protein